jgi:serine/threonine protein kinase
MALHHVHSRKVKPAHALHAGASARVLNSTQVLHRDIKAQNIFIAANGAIKIGDLGVAKLLGTRMQVRLPHDRLGPLQIPPRLRAREFILISRSSRRRWLERRITCRRSCARASLTTKRAIYGQ